MRTFLATALITASAAAAHGQFPYTASAFTQTYAPLPNGYTVLDVAAGWDDPTVPFALPFLFPIGGDETNTLSISGLGIEVFAENESGLLHILWPVTLDIMDVSAAGDVAAGDVSTYRTAVTGTAPNRIFKLEYHNAGFYNEIELSGTSTQRMDAQVWLHEASGIIEYHFGPNTVTDWTVLSDGMMSTALLLDFDYYSYAGLVLAASGPVAEPTWSEYNDLGLWIQSMATLSDMPADGQGYRFTPAGATGVEQPTEAAFGIAPNPASETVTVANGGQMLTLRVFDPTGRAVEEVTLQAGERRLLDVSGFAPGVYTLHGGDGGARRLVVQ
jgi:hypothetical protein